MLAPVERAPTTRRGVGGRARALRHAEFGDPVPPANRTLPFFEPEPRVSRGQAGQGAGARLKRVLERPPTA